MKKWFKHNSFKQQHLLATKAKIYWPNRNFCHSARLKSATFEQSLKIVQIYKNFIDFVANLEAREVVEISDWSTIFSIWCHMSVHIKLYAYMTLIYENMIKNAKNMPKIRFLYNKFEWKSCIKCQNRKPYHIYHFKFKHISFFAESTK